MEVFNNREIALAVWLLIFSALAVTKASVRKSLYNIVKICTRKVILIVLVLMVLYISLLVYGLYELGVWDRGQLKNTILWSSFVGAASLFRVNKITDDPHYFKKAVKDNLGVLVVLEFIIGFYTFPLLLELLIVPVAAVLGMMLAVAQADKKFEPVTKLLNSCLALFGGGLMAHATYKLLTDFGFFATRQTLTDFSLPPLMSLFYMPFLYVMAVCVNYESVFLRLRFSIKDRSLRAYAKRRAILSFHLRTGLLKRWARNLMTSATETKEDIDNAIRDVIILRARERRPVEVPYDRGWSPYAARDFLSSEGLTTEDYHRVRGNSNEWYASSPYLKVGNSIIPEDISYYVEGDETAATALKLVRDVNVRDMSEDARKKFNGLARLLFKKALHKEMPAEIENRLSSEAGTTAHLKNKEIRVSKKLWPEHRFGGYTIKFIIQNPKEQI